MPVTVATFREQFPEFGDATAYPDAQVQFQISYASKQLNPERWGDLLDEGTSLIAAHNLALSRISARSGVGGGIPGAASGLATSKSVGGASVSYDVSVGSVEGFGPYNLTLYGRQYAYLMSTLGAGGFQL